MNEHEHPHPRTITRTTFNFKWFCSCGRQHESQFQEDEPGDADWDGFNFHCECGNYYKKWYKVPDSQILEESVTDEQLTVNTVAYYCRICQENPDVYLIPLVKHETE